MIFQCESDKILVIYYCQCSPWTNQLILVSMPKSRVDKLITDMLTLMLEYYSYGFIIITSIQNIFLFLLLVIFISNFYGDD